MNIPRAVKRRTASTPPVAYDIRVQKSIDDRRSRGVMVVDSLLLALRSDRFVERLRAAAAIRLLGSGFRDGLRKYYDRAPL